MPFFFLQDILYFEICGPQNSSHPPQNVIYNDEFQLWLNGVLSVENIWGIPPPVWESVHCCYDHVCFVQVTTCGAPNGLTCLGVRTFYCYLTFLDHRTNICRKVRAPVGSAKQVSKLSLGQSKHRQNITTRHTVVHIFNLTCSSASVPGALIRTSLLIGSSRP